MPSDLDKTNERKSLGTIVYFIGGVVVTLDMIAILIYYVTHGELKDMDPVISYIAFFGVIVMVCGLRFLLYEYTTQNNNDKYKRVH